MESPTYFPINSVEWGLARMRIERDGTAHRAQPAARADVAIIRRIGSRVPSVAGDPAVGGEAVADELADLGRVRELLLGALGGELERALVVGLLAELL